MSLTLIEGWRSLTPEQKGASVALGAFDGVHRGHRQVIAEAAKAAQALDVPLGVIRFLPHPARVMRPDSEPFLLMTPGQQDRALEALGVERLYDIPFDLDLAQLSATRNSPGACWPRAWAPAMSPSDSTSPSARAAPAAPRASRGYGQALGFGVTIVEAVEEADGGKVSSAARQAIREGDVGLAARILGRPFAIEGVVEEGQHLGRKLGFPTANVELGDYVKPRLGTYATRTRLPDGRLMPGVASIGENPTTGLVKARLEVWLFDFDEDLYGQVIETDLGAFLRPELTFDGLDALVAQVMADAAQARALLMPAF